jgi:hypothetical protein
MLDRPASVWLRTHRVDVGFALELANGHTPSTEPAST